MTRRWALVGAWALAACGSPAPAPRAPSPAPAPQLHRGPLTDYVAAAGLRWMVLVRPRELWAAPDVARALGPLFPTERLAAFEARNGVGLAALPSALVAGYDYGTLYLGELALGQPTVERLFQERLLPGARVQRPAPGLVTIAGSSGPTPTLLVSAESAFVGVSVDDPTPGKVAAAYARNRLKSPPALRGAALSTLPAELSRAPLAAWAAGPFDDTTLGGAHGLLAATLAIGATATPSGDELRVFVALSGDWSEAPEEVAARLSATMRDLETSRVGRLIGLDRPIAEPTVSVGKELATVSVRYRTSVIGKGLYDAVGAQVREMMETPPR
jgi:hypothetical protein